MAGRGRIIRDVIDKSFNHSKSLLCVPKILIFLLKGIVIVMLHELIQRTVIVLSNIAYVSMRYSPSVIKHFGRMGVALEQ